MDIKIAKNRVETKKLWLFEVDVDLGENHLHRGGDQSSRRGSRHATTRQPVKPKPMIFRVFNIFKHKVPTFWPFYQLLSLLESLGRNPSFHLQDLSLSSLLSPLLGAFYDILVKLKIKKTLLVARNDAYSLDPSNTLHF
uniref:Uncharacterized protein n=1 Tax=Lactuca sativa TaxID=4236 RepID=A0A9R1XKP0_LACSA|nr:hypothetical protein LSAT_V11C400173760 [Lactuca sativa]